MSENLENFSLMDLFRAEAETQTAVLAEGLVALEKADAGPELIESLMRAAHSLKGAARIVGLDAAVRVAHVTEDYFVAVQKSKIKIVPTHVDVLLRGVDLLNQISQWVDGDPAQWLAENEPVIGSYTAELRGILDGKSPGPTPKPVEEKPPPAAEEIKPPPQPVVAAEPVKPVPIPEASTPAAKPATAERTDRVVRVTADSLTRLMGLAGESLVEARQFAPFVESLRSLKSEQAAIWANLHSLEERLGASDERIDIVAKAKAHANQCAQLLTEKLVKLEDFAHRSEDLSARLHHEVIVSRMRPLGDGIRGFARMVRDISRQLGKQVEFQVRGENTGVDRDILDKLEAPLNHLIRNSLDHGIEMPEERLAAGKPAAGTIRLEAHHRAGMLQITLRDDGRGIHLPRLRAKVVERGHTSASMAEKLTDAELYEFLFLPGFSTKEAVSELSGRGVGLDVVQSMVHGLGGNVRVASTFGKETAFTLRLPISMSVIRALIVEILDEPYAFPLTRIDRIDRLKPERVEWLEGRPYFTFDQKTIGLVPAGTVLELDEMRIDKRKELHAVVISDRGHQFGIVVDKFLGEHDLDVRPLDARLGKVPNISSVSIHEDGSPILILDVEDLVRSIDVLITGRRLKRRSSTSEMKNIVKRILVVDDSMTVREIERQLLTMRGYEVDVAVDGMDGWNAVRGGDYHLVVSDVDMPRMDGIELVTRIKQDPRLKALPVVIVSYKEREEDRMRGLDAGANCYLTKSSFHDQTFLRAISDLIGEART